MAIDTTTYAAAKKYTDKVVAGGGAIAGKNCTVDSIMAITGGHRVTFKWTLDNGTVQTNYMDVMDGVDGAPGANGLGVKSVDINANNHLIITYDDDTTHDAGLINAQGQTIQRNVLPAASEDESGHIYQYIGVTDANYTNGYFYECVLDGLVYKWEVKSVQPGSGVIDQTLDKTSHNAVENMAIAVPMEALQGSVFDLKLAIQNLDLLMASKVDKETGKGLSTNDFTDEYKEKVVKLQPIYMIGSGLNLDGSVLKATGIDIPIDTELDSTSANPVQNKAIAVPVQALQGSLANVKLDVDQLLGSVVDVKQDVNNIQLDITQLQGSLANVKLDVDQLLGSIVDVKQDVNNIQLDITQLQGSLANVKLDVDQLSGSVVDVKQDVNNIQLDVTQLQGSVLNIKLDIDQLQGSLLDAKTQYDIMPTADADLNGRIIQYVGATDSTYTNGYFYKCVPDGAGYKWEAKSVQAGGGGSTDEFIGPEYVTANHTVEFDNLDDSYGYKIFGYDTPNVRPLNIVKTNGTDPGTYKLIYTVSAPQNTPCGLRVFK